MQSSAVGKRSQAAGGSSSCASLSVVVVSTGSATAPRAAQALRSATRDLFAQVIVVAQHHEAKLAGSIEYYDAEVIVAPSGCSRAEMCDLGMSRASGTIVAVRDDVSVGDAMWLDAYRRVLPKREVSTVAQVEAVVMDTLVASGAPLADRVALEAVEARGNDSAIRIAAAV